MCEQGNSTWEGDIVGDTIVAIYSYYIPTLVIFGTIGNVLSVGVFFGSKLRKKSSSFYLAAVAISDLTFLITLFINWMANNGYELFFKPVFCQLFNALMLYCQSLSAWFIVAFVVERSVALRYPQHRNSICTVTR